MQNQVPVPRFMSKYSNLSPFSSMRQLLPYSPFSSTVPTIAWIVHESFAQPRFPIFPLTRPMYKCRIYHVSLIQKIHHFLPGGLFILLGLTSSLLQLFSSKNQIFSFLGYLWHYLYALHHLGRWISHTVLQPANQPVPNTRQPPPFLRTFCHPSPRITLHHNQIVPAALFEASSLSLEYLSASFLAAYFTTCCTSSLRYSDFSYLYALL